MSITVNAFATLAATDDFSTPVEELDLDEKVEAYAAAMFVEDAAKARRESLREALLEAAEKGGKANEKGGHKLVVGSHSVARECRTASAPDEKKLMSLLESKGLAVEKAFDKVTVLQPNPSKVSALVEAGHLTKEEAAALYRKTYALVVRVAAELEALYEGVTPATMVTTKKSR